MFPSADPLRHDSGDTPPYRVSRGFLRIGTIGTFDGPVRMIGLLAVWRCQRVQRGREPTEAPATAGVWIDVSPGRCRPGAALSIQRGLRRQQPRGTVKSDAFGAVSLRTGACGHAWLDEHRLRTRPGTYDVILTCLSGSKATTTLTVLAPIRYHRRRAPPRRATQRGRAYGRRSPWVRTLAAASSPQSAHLNPRPQPPDLNRPTATGPPAVPRTSVPPSACSEPAAGASSNPWPQPRSRPASCSRCSRWTAAARHAGHARPDGIARPAGRARPPCTVTAADRAAASRHADPRGIARRGRDPVVKSTVVPPVVVIVILLGLFCRGGRAGPGPGSAPAPTSCGSPRRARRWDTRPRTRVHPFDGVRADVVEVGTGRRRQHRHAARRIRSQRRAGTACGPTPGEPGTAIIVGHVDTVRPSRRCSTGCASCAGQADPGRPPRRPGRHVHGRVGGVVPEDRLPGRSDLQSDDRPPRLALVTCGGAWVGGDVGYTDNVIVFATLV